MNLTKGDHVVSCMRKPKRRTFAYRFMRYGTYRIDHTRGGLGVYKYIYIYYIYIYIIYYIYYIYIYIYIYICRETKSKKTMRAKKKNTGFHSGL